MLTCYLCLLPHYKSKLEACERDPQCLQRKFEIFPPVTFSKAFEIMAVFCICVVMGVTGHMEPQGTGNVLSSLLYLIEIKVKANLMGTRGQ